ncbi:MAG: HAMP domain-containing histidine kinase [Desulfobacterales bacterium]|nr:HAMP domain-containing histidine kinase [Desulfobacterales bacterium]
MKEQNALSEESLGLLVRMIIHDLDAPLAVASRVLERIMQNKYDPRNPTHQRLVKTSAMAIERSKRMLRDLGDITSTRKIPINMRECQLSHLVEMIAREFQPLAEIEDREFHWSCLESGICNTDPDIFHRLVENLLLNALHHTDTGGMIRLEANIDRISRGVTLNVSNTGRPIPEEYLQTIFKAEVQLDLKAERKWKGHGLGLAFCKLAALALGGEIHAQNLLDQEGVQFIFEVKRGSE